MKLINRSNFLSIVCISFTLIVSGKLIAEAMAGITDPYYTQNIFTCLAFSFIITFILSLHFYLQRFPFIPVFIGQYAVTIGIVCLAIYIGQQFTDFAPSAYRDMIISVTIPFLIGAIVYYISFFAEIKKANKVLEEMNFEKNT